jgi:hypothetical protein
MLEQIDGIGNISRLKERLTRDSYKKLVIFGAGINGLFISECLDEYNWTAFLDNKVKTVSNVKQFFMLNKAFYGIGGIRS